MAFETKPPAGEIADDDDEAAGAGTGDDRAFPDVAVGIPAETWTWQRGWQKEISGILEDFEGKLGMLKRLRHREGFEIL